MAEDLAEIHERLAFCAEELNALSAAAASYVNSAIETFRHPRTSMVDPNILAVVTGRSVRVAADFDLYAKIKKPVPTAIRSKTGMIANEARACLDALACRLAERNGKTSAGVYFPISQTKAIFETDGMKKMAKLAQADREKIATGGRTTRATPLYCGFTSWTRNANT